MSNNSFRSGYVAIVGWPNVGKSTLINSLVGAKLSIVTPKPQTTRESILGIVNEKDKQIIFVDTPGWLKPSDPFQSQMKKSLLRSIHDDSDVLLWLIEPRLLSETEWDFARVLGQANKPLVVAINKCDSAKAETVEQVRADVKTRIPTAVSVASISAKNGQGVADLKQKIASLLPESPPYFPQDQITDRWERFYVAELIRERMFKMYQQEVPHAAAVVVEDFAERAGRKDHIVVHVFVETEGQKRIVIGHKGHDIKELSQSSRVEIENQLGRPIYLELLVKVRKNWRKDAQFLKQLEENARS